MKLKLILRPATQKHTLVSSMFAIWCFIFSFWVRLRAYIYMNGSSVRVVGYFLFLFTYKKYNYLGIFIHFRFRIDCKHNYLCSATFSNRCISLSSSFFSWSHIKKKKKKTKRQAQFIMRTEISQWQIPPKLSSLLLLTFLGRLSKAQGRRGGRGVHWHYISFSALLT